MRRYNSVFIYVLAALAASAMRPVHAQDGKPELDLWPLFYYDTTDDETASVTEALWPFFEAREDPEWKQTFFRPFWNRRIEKGKEFDDQEILWPFARITKRGATTHRRFFPFRFKTEEVKEDETEVDDVAFPFVFKRRKKGEDSTAIFPFYGHMKNRFSRDEIKFVMWPIYSWQRTGDVTATSILWPIFSISDYPGGGGLKVWPLFGVSQKKGHFKKSFLLWPLYNYRWAKLKQGGEYECAVMPLVAARERSPAGKSDGVIWPLFLHTEDYQKKRTDDWFPWPLAGKGRGENYKKDVLMPFFSSTQDGGNKDDVILWPIGWFSERKHPDSTYRSARIFPLWYDTKEEWAKDQSKETYFQFWPFFHTSKKREGVERTECLSPFLLKEDGGWERNWAPFFWIFQTGREKDGVKYDHIGHRIYRHESGEDYRLFEIKHVLRFWQEGPQSELALFSGLRFQSRKEKK
ncbi:MAG: hypothetical protein AB1696_08705 [Planctomycetota bacterium]